jgi:hypothetical protein
VVFGFVGGWLWPLPDWLPPCRRVAPPSWGRVHPLPCPDPTLCFDTKSFLQVSGMQGLTTFRCGLLVGFVGGWVWLGLAVWLLGLVLFGLFGLGGSGSCSASGYIEQCPQSIGDCLVPLWNSPPVTYFGEDLFVVLLVGLVVCCCGLVPGSSLSLITS